MELENMLKEFDESTKELQEELEKSIDTVEEEVTEPEVVEETAEEEVIEAPVEEEVVTEEVAEKSVEEPVVEEEVIEEAEKSVETTEDIVEEVEKSAKEDDDKEEDEKDEKKEAPGFMKEAEAYLTKGRKLFLWGGVDDESVEKLVKQMLYLDSLNHDDITLFINSPGGVISSGLALLDCMNSIESDVVTVCAGQAASMGAVLLCAGATSAALLRPETVRI